MSNESRPIGRHQLQIPGPTPVPEAPNINIPLVTSTGRADLLIMVESKGKVSDQPGAQPGLREAVRGRY